MHTNEIYIKLVTTSIDNTLLLFNGKLFLLNCICIWNVGGEIIVEIYR